MSRRLQGPEVEGSAGRAGGHVGGSRKRQRYMAAAAHNLKARRQYTHSPNKPDIRKLALPCVPAGNPRVSCGGNRSGWDAVLLGSKPALPSTGQGSSECSTNALGCPAQVLSHAARTGRMWVAPAPLSRRPALPGGC